MRFSRGTSGALVLRVIFCAPRDPHKRLIRPIGTTDGFTLVELAAVVAIIGILSTIAVMSYRRLVNSAKTAEATNMIQAIRVAQESYHSEVGSYDNVSITLTGNTAEGRMNGESTLFPNPRPDGSKWPWVGQNPNDPVTRRWAALPVHAAGPVRFGYATVSGPAGVIPAQPRLFYDGVQVGWGGVRPKDWFITEAMSDTDGNGIYCTVFAPSWDSQVFIDHQGE